MQAEAADFFLHPPLAEITLLLSNENRTGIGRRIFGTHTSGELRAQKSEEKRDRFFMFGVFPSALATKAQSRPNLLGPTVVLAAGGGQSHSGRQGCLGNCGLGGGRRPESQWRPELLGPTVALAAGGGQSRHLKAIQNSIKKDQQTIADWSEIKENQKKTV